MVQHRLASLEMHRSSVFHGGQHLLLATTRWRAHSLTRELPWWIVPGVDWNADLFSDDIDAVNDGKRYSSIICVSVSVSGNCLWSHPRRIDYHRLYPYTVLEYVISCFPQRREESPCMNVHCHRRYRRLMCVCCPVM